MKKRIIGLLIIIYCLLCCINVDASRLEVKVGGTLKLDLSRECKIVECTSADSLLEAYEESNICIMNGVRLGETRVNVKCEEEGKAYNLPVAVVEKTGENTNDENNESADVKVGVGEGKTVFQEFSCKISECTSSNSALEVEANKDLNMCWGKGISLGNAEVTVKCEDGKQRQVNVAVVEAKADENTNGNSDSNNIYDHIEDKKIECSSFELLMKDINGIFDIVKIIIPVLIVVVSTYDFIRAVAGKVEGDTKKAFMKFIKRLVFAIIFFFLPTILNFFLGLIDPSYSTCVDLPK